MADFTKQLSKYIPEAAAPIISKWINDSNCRFKITRTRSTKLGDYRAPFKGSTHQITVNHDLNPYAFLITTIHEFAHLKTFTEHQHKVKPHGIEWKNNFKHLIIPFLKLNIFPSDIVHAISKYMSNPAASSCTDINLFRILRNYDQKPEKPLYIEDLPDQSIFQIQNGRVFQKGNKLRKRYKCLELSTNKTYLIHPLMEVCLVKDSLQAEKSN